MTFPDFNRRSLLQACACLPFVSSFPFALQASVREQDPDPFAFADVRGLGPDLSEDDIESKLIPLHNEIDITVRLQRSGQTFDRPLAILRQQFLREGLPWHDRYIPQVTEQHYGLSERSTTSEQLREYCLEVTRYLEQRLPIMTAYHPRWQLLNPSVRQASESVRAFVGRHTYVVRRFSVRAEEGKQSLPYLVNARPVDRAINIVSSRDTNAGAGMIYVIAGGTSLTAPFSELLHLVTHQPGMAFLQERQREVGYNAAQVQMRELTESLTEAAAISLASTYIRNAGHAARLQLVLRHARSLNRQFSLFGPMLSLIESEGPFSVIKQYRRDPFSIADRFT